MYGEHVEACKNAFVAQARQEGWQEKHAERGLRDAPLVRLRWISSILTTPIKQVISGWGTLPSNSISSVSSALDRVGQEL